MRKAQEAPLKLFRLAGAMLASHRRIDGRVAGEVMDAAGDAWFQFVARDEADGKLRARPWADGGKQLNLPTISKNLTTGSQ